MSVLLMTATINSGYFGNISTTITDTDERRKQYEDALTKYIRFSSFDKIVFAENSHEKLNESYYLDMANAVGKQVEFLDLPGNNKVMKIKGKSYGEAALIHEAFQKSVLISTEPAIYKVTGRIWINNINSIVDDKPENCFVAHNFKSWVLTSFFKITSEDYWTALSSAPEMCNDNTDDSLWCIEHTYYELLKNAVNPVRAFSVYPDMRGINSGSGARYTKTKKQLIVRNIITVFKLNQYDPKRKIYYPFLSFLEYMKHR